MKEILQTKVDKSNRGEREYSQEHSSLVNDMGETTWLGDTLISTFGS